VRGQDAALMLAMLLDARPRGHEKPPQGQIRLLARSVPRRVRVTRCTASRNTRRYDKAASSGPVVGNDPVNGTDPTGLYTCSNPQACDTFEESRKSLEQAARILSFSKSLRDQSVAKVIIAGLADIGARGIKNGRFVTNLTDNPQAAAQWLTGKSTLAINLDAFSKMSMADKAAAVGHELTHTVQDGAGMLDFMQEKSNERQAYKNGAVIGHSLGSRDLWDTRSNDIDRGRVESMSTLSCKMAVRSQDLWQLCE
jgi:hypothetical protein